MFDLMYVIKYLISDANFAIVGSPTSMEEFEEALIWHGPGAAPSWEAIQAVWAEAKNAYYTNILRAERNQLLNSTDWTQVSDVPVDAAVWAEYRQALRDLPANTTDPENPVWPTPPE